MRSLANPKHNLTNKSKQQKQKSQTLLLDSQHVWHPFTQCQTAPTPIPIKRGQGAYLFDEDDQPYLDLISSWWVNILGHCQSEIVEAIAKQAATLEQVVFADVAHAPAASIAAQLCEVLGDGFDRVFFSGDGSSALEVAMKMALQYFYNQGIERKKFLSFEGAYHGDTAGTMSAASGFFGPYKAMMFEVEKLPYPNTWQGDKAVEEKEAASLKALKKALVQSDVAALLVEPLVQGASGMRMARHNWLEEVVKLCQQHNVLVIFDEVMTGFGRTNTGDGKLFAFQQLSVKPDIICLSKGVTGGFLPMSLTICSEALFAQFLGEDFAKALAHGHSYTANPIACAAALKSLEILQRPETFQQQQMIGRVYAEMLPCLPSNCIHRRQQGTIAAFDIQTEDVGYTSALAPRLKQAFWTEGLLLRPLGNTVYFIPPYCIAEGDLRQSWGKVLKIVETL